MRGKRLAVLLSMLSLINFFDQAAFAWGPDGHRVIARLAVEGLPPETPKFFTDATEQLMFLSYEPDEWRNREEEKLSKTLRVDTDPDHHFFLELFNPQSLPEDRYSFLTVLNQQSIDPREVGVLPYRAMELFQRLRVSFRQWRIARSSNDLAKTQFLEARIIDDAGILAHYIGDASQPLHVSVNHNGWEMKANPKGYTRDNTLHNRFEDAFVKAKVKESQVKPLVGECHIATNGLSYIYAEIKRSSDQVESLYALENAKRFGPDDDNPKAQAFVDARLADAATVLRDLWYTAYVTSAPNESK